MTGSEVAVALTVALLVWLGPLAAFVALSWPRGAVLHQWGEEHPGWWWLVAVVAFFALGFAGVQASTVVA